jgi:hypothetical protein
MGKSWIVVTLVSVGVSILRARVLDQHKSRLSLMRRPSSSAQPARQEDAVPVNQYERAFRAWPLLTARASQRSKVTYAELAEHLGIHPRPIRYVLGVIQDWCLRERKPPLTILVVSQSGGHPGQGFIAWDAGHLDEGYEEVFASTRCPCPWPRRSPPPRSAMGAARTSPGAPLSP